MKKPLVCLAVTLLLLALVSCGSEGTTAVSTTESPAGVSETPLWDGIDIMNGDYDYMALDPCWNSIYGFNFENYHEALDRKWALVIKLIPCDSAVQDNFITKSGKIVDSYQWSVIINGEEIVIEAFDNLVEKSQIFVHMSLGEWTPAAGINDYDVKLKISEKATGKVAYWTWFTDPTWVGAFSFKGDSAIEFRPDQKPDNVKAIATDLLKPVSGPSGATDTESYVNIFDGEIGTKLCTTDVSTPIVFEITGTDVYSVTGISLVGANDDATYSERVPYKFTLYGSSDGRSWQPVLNAARSEDYIAANYQESYFAFGKTVTYAHYKLVIEEQYNIYQFSELVLYYQ